MEGTVEVLKEKVLEYLKQEKGKNEYFLEEVNLIDPNNLKCSLEECNKNLKEKIKIYEYLIKLVEKDK